jgi:hypothetical protein
LKEEPKSEAEKKEEEKKEKTLEKQNKLYFKYRNALADLKMHELHSLLEQNGQSVLAGRHDVCI